MPAPGARLQQKRELARGLRSGPFVACPKTCRLWSERAQLVEFEALLDLTVCLHRRCCAVHRNLKLARSPIANDPRGPEATHRQLMTPDRGASLEPMETEPKKPQ